MAFIGLAPFPDRSKPTGEMKFCFGDSCNKELPRENFPKNGGKFCKKCISKKFTEKRRRIAESKNPFKK